MRTILGIDPGSRYMGIAVLRGEHLIASGVHTLKNGRRPYDLLGQARAVIVDYIKEHRPDVVAIERPLLKPTKRGALVTVIAQELRARSSELGVHVVMIPVKEVRKAVTGHEWAKKVEVAMKLADRFPDLASRVPVPPKRAALGLRPQDRYWLHLFDALAAATAVEQRNDDVTRRAP
jgi:Holliday junction resolvasome RuvABC endonuclease subunit